MNSETQVNINEYCVLLMTGEQFLLNLILISASVFSIGTLEFCFSNISAFIAFTPALVSSNFKYISEMPCEFHSICIRVSNGPLTSLSCKSIFTANITLALILILRIAASPPVSFSFRYNTWLIFCIEAFFSKLSIAFIIIYWIIN